MTQQRPHVEMPALRIAGGRCLMPEGEISIGDVTLDDGLIAGTPASEAPAAHRELVLDADSVPDTPRVAATLVAGRPFVFDHRLFARPAAPPTFTASGPARP